MTNHNPSAHDRDDTHSRKRLIERLDGLVASGALPMEMAEQVRASDDPAVVDAAIRHIRRAHARQRVDDALKQGRLDKAEGEAILKRLTDGEDPDRIPGMRSGFRHT
jgi:hypothetical protein